MVVGVCNSEGFLVKLKRPRSAEAGNHSETPRVRTGVTASGIVGEASSDDAWIREDGEKVLVEEKDRVVVGEVSNDSRLDVGVWPVPEFEGVPESEATAGDMDANVVAEALVPPTPRPADWRVGACVCIPLCEVSFPGVEFGGQPDSVSTAWPMRRRKTPWFECGCQSRQRRKMSHARINHEVSSGLCRLQT